jgi:hypothetical protein
MKKTIMAAVSIAVLAFTSSAASAQVCVVGILAAAIYASAHDHRELTSKEAATCGLAYGLDTQKPEAKKKEKVARRTKAKAHAKPAN